MKTVEAMEEANVAERTTIVRFPAGIPGFEQVSEYLFLSNPGEEPFLRLQMLQEPKLSFLVVSPFAVLPTYRPAIASQDAEFLQLSEPADALIFNIVTVHGKGCATVNLKGPIILNKNTLVAKQVILANAAEYDLQFPLPVA